MKSRATCAGSRLWTRASLWLRMTPICARSVSSCFRFRNNFRLPASSCECEGNSGCARDVQRTPTAPSRHPHKNLVFPPPTTYGLNSSHPPPLGVAQSFGSQETQLQNAGPGHSHWTQPLDTASAHSLRFSSWTQPLELRPWTQPLDPVSGRSPQMQNGVRPLDASYPSCDDAERNSDAAERHHAVDAAGRPRATRTVAKTRQRRRV